MSAPRNSRSVGRSRWYDFNGLSAPSVTTVLDALPKWSLMTWYASQAAGAAVEALRSEKTTADVFARLAEEQFSSHAETKTHQERHKNKCDFEANAVNWLARAAERVRDAAGDRGTAVHKAAEHDYDVLNVPENARLAYGSYQKWLADFNPDILAKEFQVFRADPYRPYAGSGDLIAEVGGIVYIIDLKTGRSIRHDYRLQLAAYRYGLLCIDGAEIDHHGTDALERIERCAILHLTDTGYEFVEVEAGEAEHETFLTVYDVWSFMERTKDAPVGQIILPPIQAAA